MSEPMIVGVADHNGWAVFVCVTVMDRRPVVADRRRVELIESELPTSPIHHEAQELPYGEAEELVATVRDSVARSAASVLVELSSDLDAVPSAIAIRDCPPLPDSLEEKISSWTAQNSADSVMYRELLAEAAADRGWGVHWFDRKRVEANSAAAAKCDPAVLREFLTGLRSTMGAPWQKDHRMATAAAIEVLAHATNLQLD